MLVSGHREADHTEKIIGNSEARHIADRGSIGKYMMLQLSKPFCHAHTSKLSRHHSRSGHHKRRVTVTSEVQIQS